MGPMMEPFLAWFFELSDDYFGSGKPVHSLPGGRFFVCMACRPAGIAALFWITRDKLYGESRLWLSPDCQSAVK